MRALILVDLQNDFFPGGNLEVKEGNKVLPVINELLELPFDLIVATKDWHPENHVSFASTHNKEVGDIMFNNDKNQILWPKHCIQNSKGAEFAPGWNPNKIEKVVHKGTAENIDSYSTFFDNAHNKSTGLEKILKSKHITQVFLAGLATEYCVKFSALDAKKLGFEVFVVSEGCRGVNLKPEDSEKAFREMELAGITIIRGPIKNFKELNA